MPVFSRRRQRQQQPEKTYIALYEHCVACGLRAHVSFRHFIGLQEIHILLLQSPIIVPSRQCSSCQTSTSPLPPLPSPDRNCRSKGYNVVTCSVACSSASTLQPVKRRFEVELLREADEESALQLSPLSCRSPSPSPPLSRHMCCHYICLHLLRHRRCCHHLHTDFAYASAVAVTIIAVIIFTITASSAAITNYSHIPLSSHTTVEYHILL